MLTAIAGFDANDNYTSAIPFNGTLDYVEACDFFALSGKRIGVPRNYIGAPDDVIVPAFNAALDVLRAAGATVIDNITLPGYDVLATANFETVTLGADFITDLYGLYFSKLTVNPHNIASVVDLQNFTRSFPLEDYPERDTDVWQDALDLGFGNDSPEFWSNYTAQLYYAGPLGITGALKNYSLDALVVPTSVASYLPALIGSPIITVPLGRFPDGTEVTPNGFGNLNATGPNFPFGFSFLGDRFDEYNLIGLAYAFEQRTLVRNTIKPYIEPTTELVDVVNKRKMKARHAERLH